MTNIKYNEFHYIICNYSLHLTIREKLKMNRIKQVLVQKGIKQVWLADQLGKSYNVVNGYVQNRNQPSIEVLYEIARILDVNVRELLLSTQEK